ncbi:acyl-phosphate glycerol 3-phosphate acyltransferase [Longibacter salinarum]|uniref:Glycerol-3-phosphate acyltransferase n=1 Tax=Longibacter salinarum TaxID=1850348 RepID=A0A2A8D243_9BACT|nr:glycerol-3-phosphate 1-O-acyltransferase PlsY [Longibacter salinarum]PEN15042.1 acyl-phosphate glycerol 3-phosphate acyltransferase [Longibacter salinarum]
MLSLVVVLLLSYVVGSIPGSLWSSKLLYGIDVREHGSGNAGATNTFRVVGWQAGVVATIVDMGKGAFAAGVLPLWTPFGPHPTFGMATESHVIVALLCGLAAVVGHMFPIFAKFRGGKGVNTAAGILLALTPISTLLTMLVFVIVLGTTRYVSLGSILAAAAFPTIVAIRKYAFGADLTMSLLIFGIIVALAIIVAHQSNIRRLLAGNENRVSSFKPAKGMRGRGEI